jgi:hypothetical protein
MRGHPNVSIVRWKKLSYGPDQKNNRIQATYDGSGIFIVSACNIRNKPPDTRNPYHSTNPT